MTEERKIFFGIPSYHRAAEQSTLEMLEGFGIEPARILLGVQCADDLETYKKYGGRAIILYRPGASKSANANQMLDYIEQLHYGSRLVLMDDDIKGICFLSSGKKLSRIETRQEFLSILNVGFSIAGKHKAAGFGLYPVCNGFFMSRSYVPKSICIGTLLGLTVTRQRFREDFPVKEDYEYTASAMERYGAFPRLNNFSCDAKHYTKGGCDDLWQDNHTNKDCARRLCELHPRTVKPNKAKPGEVRMAHESRAIPYRWKYERKDKQ